MKTILIESNGSKWAGQEPDSIEVLLRVLEDYTLDPAFEEFGGFGYRIKPRRDWPRGHAPKGYEHYTHQYFGNFLTLSHCFNIFTCDLNVIAKLDAAIYKNKKTAAYIEAAAERERDKIARKKRDRVGLVKARRRQRILDQLQRIG